MSAPPAELPLQLRVFLTVWPDLSPTQYRPLKQIHLAHRLGVNQQGVSYALRCLVRAELLELGPKDGPANTYRLNLEHPLLARLYRR